MFMVKHQDFTAPDEAVEGNVVIEAIGFTKGDHSSASKGKMKLHALVHVLDRIHTGLEELKAVSMIKGSWDTRRAVVGCCR